MLKSELQFLNGEINRPYRVPYALHRVPSQRITRLVPADEAPSVGTLALAKVVEIGKNVKIETIRGRLGVLFEGDLIAVVFGHRYATNQFEGYAEMRGDRCDLLTSAGVCGVVVSKHDAMPPPTRLQILGYLGDAEKGPLKLMDFSMKPVPVKEAKRPCLIVVCGGAMDSGKTYTAGGIIRGLVSSGYSVGAGKLTGTAAGKDCWQMLDAGASYVYDFTDCGFPSTFGCTLEELLLIFESIISNLAEQGAEYIVLEIADGLLEGETAAILDSKVFTDRVDGFVYVAADSLSAVGGLTYLRSRGIEPIAFSGTVSRSPLGISEVERATGIACLSVKRLISGEFNKNITSLLTLRR